MRHAYFDVHRPAGLNETYAAMHNQGAGVLIVLPMSVIPAVRAEMLKLAKQHRLPVFYPWMDIVYAGGLANYGANEEDMYRRAARYVDKILKGARPGDLPIEHPHKFDFVLNAKAARVIGLSLPHVDLTRTDRVQR